MKLLDDLPRGRHAEFVGKPPNAHFESPVNIASTESLRFDVVNNRGSKIFLGTVGGRIVTGERLPDGRLTRWVEGGIPIGRHPSSRSTLKGIIVEKRFIIELKS